MNLNTEKFKVVCAQSTGRTFVGLITGKKSGTKKEVVYVKIEESEGVNTEDNRAVEKFLNEVDKSRLQITTLDIFQKSELSEGEDVDNYVLVDITPEYAGKDCIIRYKTRSHTFGTIQSNMTYKRNEVAGTTPVKKAEGAVGKNEKEKTRKKETNS